MLLTSVIIILREVLEAALIISVLLALGEDMPVDRRWVIRSIGVGLLGAVVYAGNTAMVSDWLDGVGQEVINAFMQIAIYCCLTLITVLCSRRNRRGKTTGTTLVFLMTANVSLAIMREGSEILIYLSSFTDNLELLKPILLGSMVGAGIGASVGVLAYYVLLYANRNWSPFASIAVIMLIGAGIAGQAILLLIQADWLPAQAALWDTSGWIAESSVTGQLLYALTGYEATPTPIHATAYFGGLLLPLALLLAYRRGSGADA